ncbi:MAG: nitroreductase family protein [Gammaproteobacteria bacterium]|nr:nitroreductase family protein [Gammaproteobacteria bacterium]
MSYPEIELSNRELLTTTRSVRKRLDLEKPVPMALIEECMEIAVQAPSGSNAQGWEFIFITDETIKSKIGEIYARAWQEYIKSPNSIEKRHSDSNDEKLKSSQKRSAGSADFLSRNIGKVPILMIPCYKSRPDNLRLIGQATRFASIYPAVWNFMLAARTRGLGTSITTMHLMFEKEVSELLGIPYDDYMQCGLIPIAYTKGTDFKPAYRPAASTVMHINKW